MLPRMRSSETEQHPLPSSGCRGTCMQDVDVLRKADVSSAASRSNVAFEEKVYGRVMKELCTSRGGVWTMKKDTLPK